MPRILTILPGSTREQGLSVRTTGHRNRISPPPLGAAPRRLICASIHPPSPPPIIITAHPPIHPSRGGAGEWKAVAVA